MKRKICLLFIVLITCIPGFIMGSNNVDSGTGSSPANAGGTGKVYWPTQGWKTSSPEQQGMDSGLLTDMLKEAEKKKITLHSLLVIRNGYMVLEAYFPPYKKDMAHAQNSCTKSINSAVFGVAMNEGYIKSVDQKVSDFFPEYKMDTANDNKKDMTLKHLLTMTTGINGDPNINNPNSNDILKDYFNLNFNTPLGTKFVYDSNASNALSAVIQKATGRNTFEYAKEKLFKPLGIKNVFWATDNLGRNFGGGGMRMTPGDMAKIGYLYLNNGLWDGKQLLPAQWVKDSTTKHIDNEQHGYGYQWWMNEKEGYHGDGARGQRIFVVPSKNLVVVVTAFDDVNNTEQKLLDKYIVPAAKSAKPLPENKTKLEALNSQIRKMTDSSVKPAPALNKTAKSISGKKFKIQTAGYSVKELAMRFDKNQCVVNTLETDGKHEYYIGLDNIYRETSLPSGLSVWQRGSWTKDNTFTVSYHEVTFGRSYEYIYKFDGSKVTLYIKDMSVKSTSTAATGAMGN